MNTTVAAALAGNLQDVERRIGAACSLAGRRRDEIAVLAVTKTVSVEVAALLPGMGVYDLAESRPQELWRKAALLSGVRWHLIGHLQRNKIERTLPLVHRIHSVDSERLLAALDEAPGGRVVEAFLEFNCGGEASKQGFAPEQAASVLVVLRKLQRVRIVGLMTMAPYEDEPERCRGVFAQLRDLRDRMRREAAGHPLNELSMGMSNDFEAAIAEGATVLRLGSVLFEGLPALMQQEGSQA